jgi:4-diphosphocytidyl-2-C-methyl-D-erythritol kinase
MHSEHHRKPVVTWAPAKVNLHLEVLAKRADGYHEIATLMVAVGLYDKLRIKEEKSGEIQLHCNDPRLSSGPENLVHRAATLLQRRTGTRHGARVRLTKRIPLAAGLAGGSSDAAATLVGLNQLWDLGLTSPDLAGLATELGSDVAFFLNGPAAWCTGRGEKVTPWPIGRRLWLVLASPGVGLSTADVYRRVEIPARPQSGDEIRAAASSGDVVALGRNLHNRLQGPAETLCPPIAAMRRQIESLRPAGQLMSGSGSTVFALCRNRQEARRIAHELRHGSEEETKPTVFLVQTCT